MRDRSLIRTAKHHDRQYFRIAGRTEHVSSKTKSIQKRLTRLSKLAMLVSRVNVSNKIKLWLSNSSCGLFTLTAASFLAKVKRTFLPGDDVLHTDNSWFNTCLHRMKDSTGSSTRILLVILEFTFWEASSQSFEVLSATAAPLRLGSIVRHHYTSSLAQTTTSALYIQGRAVNRTEGAGEDGSQHFVDWVCKFVAKLQLLQNFATSIVWYFNIIESKFFVNNASQSLPKLSVYQAPVYVCVFRDLGSWREFGQPERQGHSCDNSDPGAQIENFCYNLHWDKWILGARGRCVEEESVWDTEAGPALWRH